MDKHQITNASAKSNSSVQGDASSFQDLEHYVEAYEAELAQRGMVADVTSFVPGCDHPELHQIVTELLRVDLEQRYRNGQSVSLQDYVNRFPATLSDKSKLEELAFEDYRTRHLADESPEASYYANEFGIETADWSELLRDASVDAISLPKTEDSANGRTDGFLQAGQNVLDFKVLCEFGRGSFSRVYLAQQGDLANRFVVLKASRQHWDESDILARLQHTNIMPIHSVHRLDDLQIVCMPFWGTCTLLDVLDQLGDRKNYRSGQALLSTIANHQNKTVVSLLEESSTRKPPTLERVASGEESVAAVSADNSPNGTSHSAADPSNSETTTRNYVDACLTMAAEIADALSHAHQRGIVHSDLKPANILLADDGRPLVLDFNLATRDGDSLEKGVGGTLPYMAPEHLDRMRDSKNRVSHPSSDIFSLGIILFELLSGRKPFPKRDGLFEDVIDLLIEDRITLVPSLKEVDVNVSASIDSIVQRCLAPNLQDRYATAENLREDLLAQLTNKPLRYAPESLGERTRKFMRRNRRNVATTVAVVLGLFAVLGMWGVAAQAKRIERLKSEASYTAFSQDADWMVSVLTSPIVDDEQICVAIERAEDWLDVYAEPDRTSIEPLERSRLANELGELALALAEVHLEQALHSTSEGDRNSTLALATKWNDRSGQYFVEAPIAVAMQRTMILEAADRPANLPNLSPDENVGSPTTALGHELLSRRLAKSGRLTEALEQLNEANSLSPNDYSVWAQLGYVHRALAEFSEAERCFSICVALRSDLSFSYFQRGVVRLESKDYRFACRDFDRCLEIQPEDSNALINRALGLKGLGEYQRALDDLVKATKLGASETRLYLIRSDLCHALGDRSGAEEQLRVGLESIPRDERNWLSRGMAFLRKGDATQALSDFEAAVQANPNSVNGRKNMAHALSEHLERLDEAINVISDAIEIQPNDAELLGSRAVLLARAGRVGEARKDVVTALDIKKDVVTLIRAGGVYALTQENNDDVQQAFSYVRQAMAIDPKWSSLVASDPDLSSIRKNKQFQEIINAANTLLK